MSLSDVFPVQGAPTGEKADEEDYKKGWWSGMEGHGLFIDRGLGVNPGVLGLS